MKPRLLLLTALAIAGCDPAGVECTTDDMCGATRRCVDAVCTPRPDGGAGGAMDAALDRDGGPTDAGAADAGPADAATDAGPADAATDAGPTDAATDAGPADAGPVCSAALSPPGLTRRDLNYETLSSAPFGESTHTNLLVELSETSFASIAFRTPDTPFQRRWVFVDAPTSHNMPALDNIPTMTVSSCPGDFTASALCTLSVAGASTTVWLSTRPEDASSSLFCRLEPGQDYYLNFVASDAPLTRPPTCTDSPSYDSRRCAVFFSESVLSVDL